MKGYKRHNVAKLLLVDVLLEIPAKTLYGIQIVEFARHYIQFVRQMIKHRTENSKILSPLISINHSLSQCQPDVRSDQMQYFRHQI